MPHPTDSLLTIFRIVLTIGLWLAGFAVVLAGLCLLALGVLDANHIWWWTPISQAPAGPLAARAMLALTMTTMGAVMGLTFVLLRELRRILDTVSLGDPFMPENADRVVRMGWLSVATLACSNCVPFLFGFLDGFAGRSMPGLSAPELPSLFDLSGVIFALALFVLARVFRVGAAMRQDLEGTV